MNCANRILRVLAVSVCAAIGCAQAESLYFDAVAAVVRDEVITVFDLHRVTQRQETELRRKFKGEELQRHVVALRRSAAQQLIEDELVYAEFQELGAHVPNAFLQEELDRDIRALSGGDRSKFEQRLLASGSTPAEYEQTLRRRLAIRLLLQERVYRGITIRPSAVKQYYEAHADKYRKASRLRLEAIVLRKDGVYKDALRETADRVKDELSKGAEFGSLATTFSEDPSSAKKGDLGWLEAANVNPAFRDAVQDLTVGDVSDVGEIGGNLFILRLTGREGGDRQPLEEVKEKIKTALRAAEADKRRKRFIQELREKYYVRTFF